MEFITDITVIIDGADFNDPGGLMKILQSYRHENKGSCFKVRGTFEELERLRVKLQREQTSTRVRPVPVSVAVMDYIQQKCANELSKIQGNSFVIETQPSIGTEHNSSSTMQVTLRPLHASTSLVHADLVRQRFITFYQRTASDLQITSVPMSPHHCKDIEKKFSHLLFKPSHNKNELTVSGLFVHIAKLKEFLLQNTPSSSKSSENIGPADNLSSKTLGGSPTHSKKDHENESCPICMEEIVMTKKETLRCKHSFCKGCLKQAFAYKPVCPTCGALYGTLTGTQPEGGRMNVTTTRSPLPGYEKYGTIIIEYYIPSGIQKEEHPNPGQPYEGVFRTAYLPDSSEGRRIFKLLQRAFDQKLIFTVGRSTTSGRNNTVTWNDIHHKTSTHGGPTHYGYPDPDYLRRIRDELKVKGIE